jgi:hypothetical protein
VIDSVFIGHGRKKSMGQPYRVVVSPLHLHQSRRSLLPGRLLLLLALGLGVSCGGKLRVDQNEPGDGVAGTTPTNTGGALTAGATSDAGGSVQGESGSAAQSGSSASGDATNVAGEGITGGGVNGASGSSAAGGATDVGSAGGGRCRRSADFLR